jgi:uncharacterized protein (TIGR02118 family)
MYKVFGFLKKRDGISMDEFIDYYENNHIPLILSLALTPLVYKRRYVADASKLTEGGASVDFDVMTELGFPDREAFLAWMGKLFGPDAGDQVAADEARFLDRSRTRAYVVDERVTSE